MTYAWESRNQGKMDENTAVQPADSVKNPVMKVECVQDCDGYVTGHDINH
jgi:hypothetical protein